MKRLDVQLTRLLRAAAAAPPETQLKPATVPSGHWLLSQRASEESFGLPATVRPVLQGGLAVACVLLMITLVVNIRLIGQANQDVFAVSKAALTRVSTR